MNYYTFSNKERNICYGFIVIGFISLLYGIISNDVSGARFWGNILLEGLYFTFIALGAIFFMSLQYVAQAGWATVIKRVTEALGTFLPVGILVIFLVIVASIMGGLKNNPDIVYRWMDKGATDPASPMFDALLVKKSAYLNIPFLLFRTIAVCGIWIYMFRLMRKRSIESDLNADYLPLHFKNLMTAAVYIVFFGITEQMMAWDWVMSIDYDWHSTLFGWYLFDDMWLTGTISIVLLTLYLRRKGLLQNVNENHIHNLGLWMFALSILWGYLWFFQFMFYWYTNIPDEVVYFQIRIDHYRVLFWVMFVINLVLPLIALMTRDSKRNNKFIIIIGSVLLITHWIDAYVWVMPGSVGLGKHINFFELGILLGFIGLFLLVVLKSLARVPLQVKNHPYLEESIHHHL